MNKYRSFKIKQMLDEKRKILGELLKKHRLTQVWLVYQLSLRGVSITSNTFTSYFNGYRNGDKARDVIELSIFIIQSYETLYANHYEK